MSRILCVDPEVSQDPGLEQALRAMGHSTVCASTLREGLQALRGEAFSLIFAGSRLPDGRGFELLEALRRERIDVPVIVTADGSDLESGMESLRHGAVACLMRPLRPEALRIAVGNALEADRPAPERAIDNAAIALSCGAPAMVGESRALRHALEIIRAVAPTSETVLIEGESGTGKELLARALHEESRRAGRPFVAVNCAAMPEGLIESTLFGHERGAFTGATTRFIGAFERADGGSLLLDEISELRLDLQAKLLRAIQQKQFERVGGSRPIRVDVRIISTTNQDLSAAVAAGRFRPDLYYRLNVFPVRVPPLRERLEDVPLLVRHFVDEYSRDLGIEPPEVAPQTLRALSDRVWPGNVRELQHAVVRAVVLKRQGPLEFADFRLEDGGRCGPEMFTSEPGAAGEHLPDWGTLNLRELERCAIEHALSRTGGNRVRAARLLGISDRTLRNKVNGRAPQATAPGGVRKVLPLDPAVSSAASQSSSPVENAIAAA
jgi:DNA-binding NtrC family response regulator